MADSVELQCPAFEADRTATILSSLLIAGLVVSYLPQHIRIGINKSSDGLSSGFLLLGATSSASSLFNVLVLSRQDLLCCRIYRARDCATSLLGIMQIGFQWLCFNIILILFVVYFPQRLRWQNHDYILNDAPIKPDKRQIAVKKGPADSRTMRPTYVVTYREHSDLYWQAHITAYAVLAHFALFGGFTAFIMEPGGPLVPHHTRLRAHWAAFLGILSSLLAAFQYIPQIRLTYQRKLVGSLSIPMMLIQTPGSFVFVYSLAIRPHVNWTTWITYLITGCLQGVLLILCTLYKRRQRNLGMDDYGELIRPPQSPASDGDITSVSSCMSGTTGGSRTPKAADERTALLGAYSRA